MPDLASTTALILAGGLGKRLAPVLPDRQKVLAPVNGRPFVSYLLDQIERAGCREVVLACGHKAEQVHQALGDNYGRLSIRYSRESEPMGTGGAVRQALPLIQSDDLLVLNGDSYCDVDLSGFAAEYDQHGGRPQIVLVRVPDPGRFGNVLIADDGRILSFMEKAVASFEGSRIVNGGVYLMPRRLAAEIPSGIVSLERDVFPAWVKDGLFGYLCSSPLLDIGVPDSYRTAPSFMASVTAPSEAPTDP